MAKPKRIIIVIFNGFEILDLSGPASVFSASSRLNPKKNYEVIVVSSQFTTVTCDVCITVNCKTVGDIKISKSDTILVVGANEQSLTKASNDKVLIRWLSQNANNALRFGSICSGTFLLGAAGLINHRKVTTHWAACKKLKRHYPTAKVNPDSLYVQDQNLWTSAGIASGIDMALALVEQDCGTTQKNEVAKWLVVYSHRPGYQSQFSSLLKAQISSKPFTELISWIDNNLDKQLTIEYLAAKVNFSVRSFYRKFSSELGVTPAKYIEISRLNLAKKLLETDLAVKQIPAKIGFRSESGFRQSFEKNFGLSPSMFQKLNTRQNKSY